MTVCPDVRGFRRLAAPRFEPPSGWRPGRLRFRPQSGLVQRGVCMLPAAAVVGAFKNEMKGAMMIKPYNRPAGEGKQANRPAGVEMHPFCRLRRRLSTGKRLTRFSGRFCSPTNHVRLPPRRGRFALRSAFVLISILRHNAAKTSPSGGGAVGRRGAFPTGEARFYGFRCLWQRCRRKAAIKLIARQGDTTTLSR